MREPMHSIQRWLWAAVLMATLGGVRADDVSTRPAANLTPDQELTLQTLKRQISDPRRAPETRLEAARVLLTKPYPQAARALRQFLSDSSNVAAQQAVAEAIAEDGGGKKEFIAPLMAMLTGEEPLVRSSAARALATYRDYGVPERLIAVANNPVLDRNIRRVAIEALRRVVTRSCLQALIALLSDPDPSIRSTAADSLQRMTDLRRFGSSPTMWEEWFARHREEDESVWLRDMNDRITQAKLSLERENALLRARLIEALEAQYHATARPQRTEILLAFLNDSVAEVRLLGATLTDRMVAANQEIPPEVRQRIRLMLFDDDPRVREQAAALEASLADARTAGLLLGRLRAEAIPDVRVGLLKAMGRLASPRVVSALLREIRSHGDEEAAAAAAALVRVAESQPLEETRKARAVRVLQDRYRRCGDQKTTLGLRESLLTAMGALGDATVVPVLCEALRDTAPVIRLAALNGLPRLQARDSAGAIAPLAQDEDRGVRQAALEAIILLGGKDYLKTILRRTDPRIEPDAVVRKEAREGVLALVASADLPTTEEILALLPPQPETTPLRIAALSRKADLLRAAGSPEASAVLRQAGGLLLADGRPAEAVPLLAEAWRLLAADSTQVFPARATWFEYVRAMLAADQPAVIQTVAEQKNSSDRARAVSLLLARLETLQKEQKYPAVLSLGGGAEKQLASAMSPAQIGMLQTLLASARRNQRELDRQQIEQLLPNLLSADLASREEAATVLKTMGTRAAYPLLEELRRTATAPTPDPDREIALHEWIRQVLPDIGPYDPTAEKEQRLAKIDAWLKTLPE